VEWTIGLRAAHPFALAAASAAGHFSLTDPYSPIMDSLGRGNLHLNAQHRLTEHAP
jgi:hypothetical protein